MRTFIVIVLLLAAGIGLGGYALGWFTVTVDQDKVKQDRNTVLDVFRPSPKEEGKPDADASVDQGKVDRDEFQQQAEAQFTAMDLSLLELRVRAKSGHEATKENMIRAIDELTKNAASARGELRELSSSTREQWDALKTRLGASLQALKVGLERAFAQFMNERTE